MVASAGLCLWRTSVAGTELLIVHPGGPYWAKKDDGAWSFPKGEFDPSKESGLDAARREFAEELGHRPPEGRYVELGTSRMKSGKTIHLWAAAGDLDPDSIVSNTFETEWPPRSGRKQSFPEVDRAMWCNLELARRKLNPANEVFIDRLSVHLREPELS